MITYQISSISQSCYDLCFKTTPSSKFIELLPSLQLGNKKMTDCNSFLKILEQLYALIAAFITVFPTLLSKNLKIYVVEKIISRKVLIELNQTFAEQSNFCTEMIISKLQIYFSLARFESSLIQKSNIWNESRLFLHWSVLQCRLECELTAEGSAWDWSCKWKCGRPKSCLKGLCSKISGVKDHLHHGLLLKSSKHYFLFSTIIRLVRYGHIPRKTSFALRKTSRV